MKYAIGIDFGASKIAIGLVKGKNIVKKLKFSTESNKGKRYTLKKLFDGINLVMSGIRNKDIIGIGIGVVGPLDYKKGILIKPTNLKGWGIVPLKKLIEKKIKVKTKLDNDANVAALGEHIFYKKDLICLTLGTGVGSGIIINGKIYHGKGGAAEIGQTIIKQGGIKTTCIAPGCFEEYVGKRYYYRLSKKYFKKKLEPKEIENLAKKGNKKAKRIFNETGYYLGIGLANVINIFDPELIVLTGGLSKARNLLLNPAMKVVKKYSLFKTKIVISKLREDAAILGAAYLLKQKK
jgi:glucokinase